MSTETERAAIARTLRDINDGHIQLTFSVHRFDPHTGEPLPEPVLETAADRAPAAGFPATDGPWWELLAAEGWIVADQVTTVWGWWTLTEPGRVVAGEAAGFGGAR